jgi:hypothetical protein
MPPRKSDPKTTRTIPQTATESEPKPKTKATKTTAKPKTPTQENLQPSPPAPSRAFDALVLSQDWMKRWMDVALVTENPEDACRQLGVSIADFTAARANDPEFDSLCRKYENIIDVKIMNTLCASAMKGEAHALALYYKQVRAMMIDGAAKTSDQALPPSVVEAMIRAGLEAKEKALL